MHEQGATISNAMVGGTSVAPNEPPVVSNTAVDTVINEHEFATLSGTIADPNPDDTFTLDLDWADGKTSSIELGLSDLDNANIGGGRGLVGRVQTAYFLCNTSI